MNKETEQASALDILKPSFRDIELHGGFKEDLRDDNARLLAHVAERKEWAEQGAPVFCTTEIVGDTCTITYHINGIHTADMAYLSEDRVSLFIVETGDSFTDIPLNQAIIYLKSLGYSQKSA